MGKEAMKSDQKQSVPGFIRSTTVKKQTYLMRKMMEEEVDIAIDWAANEGWNPGLYDSRCFYDTDPDGFFIAFLDNEPVGCISAVSYSNSFGFIGLYIVRPEFRKKGYGKRLWTVALEYLRDRNVGLDGVPAQQQNYEKWGFRLAYRNIRYQGLGRGRSPRALTLFLCHTFPSTK